MQKITKTQTADFLRQERARICFPVINRGKLWYNTLTPEQTSELKNWYFKWLNAPETLKVPVTPTWINNKVIEEDII